MLQDHVKLAIELSERMESSKPAYVAAFLKVSYSFFLWIEALETVVVGSYRAVVDQQSLFRVLGTA